MTTSRRDIGLLLAAMNVPGLAQGIGSLPIAIQDLVGKWSLNISSAKYIPLGDRLREQSVI